MGLCKCPKRKVTNLFCFEHRVNVCEYCLVSNHQKCVVKSYLHWLQDSDYSPECTLCRQPLATDESSECVRLVCYDVFHLSCFSSHAARLPSTTAPAGYQCPTCSGPVFPAPNVASPVVDALRRTLSALPWAREGLGLAPLSEDPHTSHAHYTHPPPSAAPSVGIATSATTTTRPVHPVQPVRSMTASPSLSSSALTPGGGEGHNPVVSSSQSGGSSGVTVRGGLGDHPSQSSGSGFRDSYKVNMGDDDEDKYKKKSALSFLARWLKSHSVGSEGARLTPALLRRRRLMLIILGVVVFLTFIVVMSQLSGGNDSDPLLDPLANPNIRVED